jgi:hypothetical protein
MTTDNKRHHLIVLIHGLWGSSQNLSRLESVIHHSLDKNSNECIIHTFAPTTFSHFKTYDGIESIGNYLIPDLLNHLENLHTKHDITINEISFIGYSLGGLIARYVIGELFNIGFFNIIKPIFFTSFATPHLGITFYKNTFLNYIGSNFLGQTGKDLFLSDGNENILLKLSDPNNIYYKGLNLFKLKICIANAKFDRSVGFYSAFITNYDPFNDWDNIDPKFIEDLPTIIIGEKNEIENKNENENDNMNNRLIECLIIDFNNTKRKFNDLNLTKNKNFFNKLFSTHHSTIIVMSIFSVLLFPIILSVSSIATIKSYYRNKTLTKPNIPQLWNKVSKTVYKCDITHISNDIINSDSNDDDSYNEEDNLKLNPVGISHVTRSIVENGLEILNEDTDLEDLEDLENLELERIISRTSIEKVQSKNSYFIDLNFELNYKSKSYIVKKLLSNLIKSDLSNYPITKNIDPLPFNSIRQKILDNLNTLDWNRIAVLLLNLNTHQSIVGRRGFERTPEIIPFLFLYTFLIETSLKTI